MKKYYIQFSTDFHLLAALSSIEDVSKSAIVLIGPETKMAKLLAGKISAELIIANPRSPKFNLVHSLRLYFRARVCAETVVISPFVFPLYTYLFLIQQACIPTCIIRTDEGVGSYASVGHYYASLRVENPGRSIGYCGVKAFVKKFSMGLTRILGVCQERYIFRSDLTVDQGVLDRLTENISLLGRLEGLEGRAVYISQPGVWRGFDSLNDYSLFIKGIAKKVGAENVLIKKHPADEFDYSLYGFDVVEGFPLELYHVDNSVVIGFSSTALLMAKIIGGCDQVYFVKKEGDGPFYNGLSPMNKRLFDFYLTPLDVHDF